MNLILVLICVLVFSITLNIIYSARKHVKSSETIIFSIALRVNLIGLILETLCIYLSTEFQDSIITYILIKIFLIYQIMFVSVMFIYVLYATIEDKKIYQKSYKTMNYIFYFLSFIVFLLPLEVDKGYSRGIATYYTFAVAGLSMFSWFILLIVNFKKIDFRKGLPLMLLVLFGSVSGVIQFLNPTITLMTCIHFFILFIMYNTIENPDVKVIAELNAAKETAEKANRAKSDFLSSMSHEIRTPLNAVVGLSEDMASRDNCPEDMKEDLNDIVSASRTLLEIVGNIMDISKIESEKMEIIEVPYNFKEEVESLARMNATRIGDKQIDYRINIAEDIPYELIGDKGHIKEVINNLLSNALKYTDRGYVELNTRCINKDNICTLIISVKDSGRGIKSEDINKLFNKFERLDVERNTTTEGTGLGLAITKKLVELMGGKINVDSNFGVGSIFVVQIPQKISKQTKPLSDTQLINTMEIMTAAKKTSINYSSKKVLIVDDNKLNIKVARRSLDQLGITKIEECYDGKQCLDLINTGHIYDLILMDIMMPVMSGETAMAELLKNDGFKTPVIALTADAIAGAEEKYKSEGFVDYIAKPFSKDAIKVKLDKIFKKTSTLSSKEREESIWSNAPTYIYDATEDNQTIEK